jgi:hypothetical protein
MTQPPPSPASLSASPFAPAVQRAHPHLYQINTCGPGWTHWKLLDVGADSDASNASLLAWRWKSDRDYRLVVVNLAGASAQGRVWIAHELPGGAQLTLTDTLHGQVFERSRADLDAHGLYVRLDANRAHLFAVTTA